MHHTDALGDVDEVVMRLMTEVNTNAACSAPGGAVVVRVEERNRSLGPRGLLFTRTKKPPVKYCGAIE